MIRRLTSGDPFDLAVRAVRAIRDAQATPDEFPYKREALIAQAREALTAEEYTNGDAWKTRSVETQRDRIALDLENRLRDEGVALVVEVSEGLDGKHVATLWNGDDPEDATTWTGTNGYGVDRLAALLAAATHLGVVVEIPSRFRGPPRA